jgi:hypothetical protein
MASDSGSADDMSQISLMDSGGSSSGGGSGIPPSAQSTSFSPVQGNLYWDYRIDHGQPYSSNQSPGLTFTFGDEIHTLTQGTLVETNDVTVSGSSTGTEHTVVTSALDPTTGAEKSIETSNTTSLASTVVTDIKLSFSPAVPDFLNRTDLDTLAIGYSENVGPATANVAGTVDLNGTSDSVTGTTTVSYTWTIMADMPTYKVLGVTYADAVQVQVSSTSTASVTDSTGASSTSTTTTSTLEWLARGIGIIYSEATQTQNGGASDTTIAELVKTNLVAPPASDAGSVAGDGGGDASIPEGGEASAPEGGVDAGPG